MSKPVYKHSKLISKKVVKCVKSGVSIKDTLASLQGLQAAPRNLATLYKLYGVEIAESRAKIISKIGSKVVDQALKGDFKSQEFYLKSKGGWSPSHTVNEVDQDGNPDEDESAIDTLMAKLGKSRDKSDKEE